MLHTEMQIETHDMTFVSEDKHGSCLISNLASVMINGQLRTSEPKDLPCPTDDLTVERAGTALWPVRGTLINKRDEMSVGSW